MPQIDIELWEAVINQSYEVEFDWIGIDNVNQIAVFSSFNKGYISPKAKLSFERYNQLFLLIDSLPRFTTSELVTKELGNFNDWLLYSQKGFYAFDYQDIHRRNKLNQYDLISKPAEPLIASTEKNIAQFLDIIPRFNIVFKSSISLQQLKEAED